MRKLLIASDCFLPRWDGIARFLHEMTPYLTDVFEVTLLVPDFGKISKEEMKKYENNIKILKIPISRIKIGDYIIPKAKLGDIKKAVDDTDVIFVNTLGTIGFFSIIFGHNRGKSIVMFMHSIDWELFSKSINIFKNLIRFITRIYIRIMYNLVDLLIIPFSELREILKRNKINRPERVVVRLGVDINKFSVPEDKGKYKEQFDIDKDKIVIGYAGRIGREKDLWTLIDAYKEIKSKYPNTVLMIAGRGVASLINKMKQDKDIRYLEPNGDIKDYLKAIDIFVMPSLTETTSLVTLEAMASGCIVVASSVGYVKLYIHDKYNGFLFPRKNKVVLKLKLENIIQNIDQYKELGEHARNTVARKFNWDTTRKTVKELLKNF